LTDHEQAAGAAVIARQAAAATSKFAHQDSVLGATPNNVNHYSQPVLMAWLVTEWASCMMVASQ
jgi:hypothetical protein